MRKGQSIITLSHLLQRYATKSLKDILAALPRDRQRIAYLAEKTAEITGLKDFPQYLTLEVGELLLNDDRQLNNIQDAQRGCFTPHSRASATLFKSSMMTVGDSEAYPCADYGDIWTVIVLLRAA